MKYAIKTICVGKQKIYKAEFSDKKTLILGFFLTTEVPLFYENIIRAIDMVLVGNEETYSFGGNSCIVTINKKESTISNQIEEFEVGEPFTLSTTAFRDLVEQWRNDLIRLRELKNDRFVSSEKCNLLIQKEILNGIKTPHGTSQPVIYCENGKYYLAAFVYFYNREDIENGAVDRPTYWAVADLESGEIVARYETSEKDFSDAPYDCKYSIREHTRYELADEYYSGAFAVLDSVRKKLIDTGVFYEAEYKVYLDKIVANIPKAYQRFFFDLSV